MCMRYVSLQQTIRYLICKISDIACGAPFWTVLVSWYPHHELDSFYINRVTFIAALYEQLHTTTINPASHYNNNTMYHLNNFSDLLYIVCAEFSLQWLLFIYH